MRRLLASFPLAVALAGCSRSEPTQGAAPPPASAPTRASKDPEAARTLIAAGAVLIDVRSEEEYASGHLPNALNLPVNELGQRLAEVDKLVAGDRQRPIVVYCATGRRSARAKRELESSGYAHVVNGGGLDDLE